MEKFEDRPMSPDLGYKDKYDHAFIVSRDSDIAPAVRKVRRNFPEKQVTVFSPFNYRHSTELIQATTHHKTIKYKHIRTSLLLEEIYDVGGNLDVRRPEKYAPQ